MDEFSKLSTNQQVPHALGATGTILNFIGNMGAASTARQAAERQRIAAQLEAAQYDQGAGQVIAAQQREAMSEKRKAQLLASRGLAVAAASGGGASDPTVARLLTDITGEGSYRAALALYAGEDRARQMRYAADVKRYEGETAGRVGKKLASAYQTHALAGLVGGGARLWGKSLYGKYAQGGPRGERIPIPDIDEIEDWGV